MQWSLFVLILMGQCSFCLCRLYEYRLVKKNKTWDEARTYCRDKYTDLAKVFDMTDMKRLNDSARNQDEAWIGLHNQSNVDRTWLWSLPGVEFNDSETEWGDGEPTDKTSNQENCVFLHNHSWIDSMCSNKLPFICYDETKLKTFHLIKCATVSNGKWSSDECGNTKPFLCYDDEVILINENKTWEQALTYCRENHHELVSIIDSQEQKCIEEVAKQANSPYVWTGLRYTCTLGFWFWITDEAVKYDNWERHGDMDECHMSGAMETSGDHKWSKKDASMKFNFICIRE
ncbi:hypothetical protein VZT92_017280 [Zoarces viviparus]|uniref:C-type lectin domain-containing protein n=1 Tax=Zoarces viviparus TaxID=48416 RepID=A0AAW1ERC3_ZOAVI